MRSFFQALERHRIRYLLVSGQAAVLHGAALFSEDIDLWVDPEDKNLAALRSVLRAQGAVFHKLTPPLTPGFAAKGHGFHFRVPDPTGGEFYLDVMGQPPRVSSFAECLDRSERMATDWGILPVIGIPDLVEIKKTQRLKDYPVISKLALRSVSPPKANPNLNQIDWAWTHVFELDDAERLARLALDFFPDWRPGDDLGRMWLDFMRAGTPREEADAMWETDRMERIAALRRADRLFWQPIIEELKTLRVEGGLSPEGQAVG